MKQDAVGRWVATKRRCAGCQASIDHLHATALYCGKPCARRADYLRHRDTRKAATARWRAENAAQHEAYNIAYREAHRETKNRQDRERKEARRAAVRLLRPRCMICFDPIQYGKSGVRLNSTTCGKRICAIRRYHWFGKAVRDQASSA